MPDNDTDTAIHHIEFELEKAQHGMALPYDAERVMQSAQDARRGAQAEAGRPGWQGEEVAALRDRD